MSVKFQYNKTSLQTLEKQLKIRERALPTLKNKESALRMEVKKAKDRANELEKLLKQKLDSYDNMVRLWGEFDLSLVRVKDVKLRFRKLAGVPTPSLEDIEFEVEQFFIFDRPLWILEGVALVKELASIAIEQDIFLHKMRLLDHARKKSTQKVNLYEKVQIPGYNDAIRKIKRFIEDEENLSKAAQKIVKSRKEQEVVS